MSNFVIGTLTTLAAGAAPATQPAPGWGEALRSPMLPLFIVILLVYFMMMRSKRNQDRQKRDLLSQMKRGDRIQTIGGIIGTVVEVRDRDVVVKVDEGNNTKVRFARSAIAAVVDEEKTADAK